eukprot:s1068_g6.t4
MSQNAAAEASMVPICWQVPTGGEEATTLCASSASAVGEAGAKLKSFFACTRTVTLRGLRLLLPDARSGAASAQSMQGHCPASVAHGTPVGGCCERFDSFRQQHMETIRRGRLQPLIQQYSKAAQQWRGLRDILHVQVSGGGSGDDGIASQEHIGGAATGGRETPSTWRRFDLQQEPSRALGSESSLVISPSQLLERLKRFPMEPPLTADRAEEMVCAMENELKALSSPVIDVSLPPVGSDPRMVVVGDTHGQLQDVLHILEENGPPSEEVAYLFNGDIVDRGRHAVEIWMLIIAYKLAYPKSVYVLRGNHENDQMIARPFKMGGGFTEECLSKYNHRVLAAFQRMFKLLPLFGVVEQEIFVVHGGLFRSPGVTLESLRTLPEADWQRNYPNPLKKDDMDRGKVWTRNEEILFDALWADPHMGLGSKRSERGRVAVLLLVRLLLPYDLQAFTFNV